MITDIRVTTRGIALESALSGIFSEIKSSRLEGKLIIGHGVGSFAHVPAKKFRTTEGNSGRRSILGASITQHSALELHDIVIRKAIASGLPAFSFSPSSAALARGRTICEWDTSPIKEALAQGFVPITHGDVVADSVQGFSVASTEEVFSYLAAELKPGRIVIGTDVDGIFDDDPKSNPDASLIEEVNRHNIAEITRYAKGSRKVDVTGGMRSKLEYLYNISMKTGAECIIINAKRKGRVRSALLGMKVIGTKINAN